MTCAGGSLVGGWGGGGVARVDCRHGSRAGMGWQKRDGSPTISFSFSLCFSFSLIKSEIQKPLHTGFTIMTCRSVSDTCGIRNFIKSGGKPVKSEQIS